MRACGALLLFLAAEDVASAQQIALSAAQQTMLRGLVARDKEAARQFSKIRAGADEALAASPNPVAVIESEGRLKSDPGKISTAKSLGDMRKVETLGWAFAVTGKAPFGEKTKEFVLAWARTNEPRGDPINETKLEPLLMGYDLTQSVFSPAEKGEVNAWLRKIATALIDHQKKKGAATSFNNWHSHRLKMLGLCGWLLGDPALIARAVSGYREQISKNLLPDGSSFDFHERDALHYHCYDLEPLLTLATAARVQGIDLYHEAGGNGATLGKAVEFLVPYCEGSQIHAEYVNSKVAFDRKRAEAGQGEFAIGHAFDPREGIPVLELAASFDEKFAVVLARMKGRKTAHGSSWAMVIGEARR
ncbi:MAG: alginate lyase [Verrucomicrobiaceae bacterium]|nr:alginate lyase [Verrucomicrobiaceae bacterium]